MDDHPNLKLRSGTTTCHLKSSMTGQKIDPQKMTFLPEVCGTQKLSPPVPSSCCTPPKWTIDVDPESIGMQCARPPAGPPKSETCDPSGLDGKHITVNGVSQILNNTPTSPLEMMSAGVASLGQSTTNYRVLPKLPDSKASKMLCGEYEEPSAAGVTLPQCRGSDRVPPHVEEPPTPKGSKIILNFEGQKTE